MENKPNLQEDLEKLSLDSMLRQRWWWLKRKKCWWNTYCIETWYWCGLAYVSCIVTLKHGNKVQKVKSSIPFEGGLFWIWALQKGMSNDSTCTYKPTLDSRSKWIHVIQAAEGSMFERLFWRKPSMGNHQWETINGFPSMGKHWWETIDSFPP